MSLEFQVVFPVIALAVVVHIFLAIFETMELRWKIELSNKYKVIALLIIWLLPIGGSFFARHFFNLRKVVGGGADGGRSSADGIGSGLD